MAEQQARSGAIATLNARLNLQTLFTYTSDSASGTLYIPISGVNWTQ